MIGRLYIDGNDAYKQYGVYVVQGGWNELIAYPPLKPVDSNDWQEEDGIEPDLSSPVLNSREVQIQFAFSDVFEHFIAFIECLSDGAYHEFECSYIKRTFRLRMTKLPNLDVTRNLGLAAIKFVDDTPLLCYRYKVPNSIIVQSDDYMIDDRMLTDYGCRVLKGTLREFLRPSRVKPNLTRDIKIVSGSIYDALNVTFNSKDVNIYCLMRGESLKELWRNYDALLFHLIRPQERMLSVKQLEQTFPCYYKSCQVTEFYPDNKIWLAFTITLTLTRDFRLVDYGTLLADENGTIVYTEDEENAIDMHGTIIS